MQWTVAFAVVAIVLPVATGRAKAPLENAGKTLDI
jgi:hypothetical protein